jgi:acetyltransferase-like isoleucine patch superfamily enzyme
VSGSARFVLHRNCELAVASLTKLNHFWRSPFLNKLNHLSTLYYQAKGIAFYRLMFKGFGQGSYIRKPLLLSNPGFIRIGNRVSIRDGVRLEVVLSNNTRQPLLDIGDDTNIEQNVHIVCHSSIRIGSKVSITGHCSIVDVTHPYADVLDPAKIGDRICDHDSFVEIGDRSFIGFGSVILPNVKIGTQAVIGANSVVTTDIPDYSVAAGSPAVVLKRFDWDSRSWVRPGTLARRTTAS